STAALAAPSVTAAAARPSAMTSAPRITWPANTVATSGPYRWPPLARHIASAATPGIHATIHATSSTTNFTMTIVPRLTRLCTSSPNPSMARDATSSRHSLAASHRQRVPARVAAGALGDGKEHVLDVRALGEPRARAQLGQRPFGDRAAVVQQHEPVADARRVR